MGTPKMIGTKDAAESLGVSERRVRALLSEQRIAGALQIGGTWAIPVPIKVIEAPRSHAHASVIKMTKAPGKKPRNRKA